MKKTLAAALLATAVAASAPAAGIVLGESRGEAAAARTFERLGLHNYSCWEPEETAFRDFFLSRDTHVLFRYHVGGHATFISALSPADCDAYFALCAAESWSNAPGTPEGIQAFVPPSRSFTNYVASVDGHILVSGSLDDLQSTLDALPALPATLSAEGDFVLQFTGNDLAAIFDSPVPGSSPEITDNIASFAAGLGLDGDTAALHLVHAPVPGSAFAADIAACGPIPPSTACVNLPGTTAFCARGPACPLRFGLKSPLVQLWNRFCATRPFAAALFPPDAPSTHPRVLAFMDVPEASGNSPAVRETFLDSVRRHSDALELAAASYRGIPVDTVTVANPDALPPFLSRHFLCPEHLAPFLASVIAPPRATVRIAWLPDGWLASFYDPGDTLLRDAIDAALDGTATPFDQSPAFRDAFPTPAAPPFALAHADLHAFAFLKSFVDFPDPCPVDLFACVAADGTHATRLRVPADLVKSIAHDSPWGAEAEPLAKNPQAAPPAPIAPVPFRGYPEAYVLSNAHVHAVVVPALSRLAFLAPSADVPNLLRFDDALADAGALPPDPSTAPDFFNIGGDWVWPVLQSNWPAFSPNASDWPPPPALADAPSDAEAWTDPDGTPHIRLTRHYPAPVHATLTREFILGPFATDLLCQQTLTRDPDAPADALPLSLWHISQVAAPTNIAFPVRGGFAPTVMAGALDPDAFSVKPMDDIPPVDGYTDLASYTPPPASEVKLSLPPTTLWAHTPNGTFAVSALAAQDPHTEIYSNTGLGYAELETVTPESSGALSNTLHYTLDSPAP